MVSTARLVETLGGRSIIKGRPLSYETLIEKVRSGLPFTALEAIATHFEIPQERLVRVLNLPLRTLARRRKERRLRADESDRLIRLALVATLAEEILGSREKAVAWLRKPNRALKGTNPLDRLDTEIGEQQVEQLLFRIAHGVYS
jgi:putative toxin-antitoxin system antitoxin component (TIGR02293 family)